MDDDRKNHSGVFQTGQKGTVPPLVTTDFIAEDQGNFAVVLMVQAYHLLH
jgi:protein transport protein SEC24